MTNGEWNYGLHSTFVILPAILAGMPAHNILVAVVDGLRASALGACGNTSFPTPAIDRFASDSFIFDWCYSASDELADIYRAMWHSDGTSLPEQLKSLGYSTTLVTDDPSVTEIAAAADFDHCVQLSAISRDSAANRRAVDISHTTFVRLFAGAADAATSTVAGSPRLVWLHSRGMYGPWDAPLELQQSLLDESDPPPVEQTEPPNLVISAGDDPDTAFRYGCAYAAQVMVLDECWESLLSAVDTLRGENRWLIALLGARGFSLGEHGRIGGVDSRLYTEQLHVPWLVRFPDATGRLARSNRLMSHLDLPPLLFETIEGVRVPTLVTDARTASRDALISTSAAGHRAIRTADWCLRRGPQQGGLTNAPGDASTSDVELFVRPDDRWEANDVAKLCPEAVDSLMKKLDESQQAEAWHRR
jgi:arylsulfatase A-like enzyme